MAPISGFRPDHTPGSRVASPVEQLLLRLWVRLFNWNLDASLAAGVDPSTRPALRARAAQLLSARRRRRLAGALERLVEEADKAPSPSFSVALGVARDQVAEARSSLLFLAYLLRHAEPVGLRGVAIVNRLLTDGGSVIYAPSARGAVELEVQVALDCLVGVDMACPEAWFSNSNAELEALVGHP